MNNDIEQEMTVQRFARLLASYGADARRWPDAERNAALALLARHAEAREMLQDAEPLEQWMQALDRTLPAFAGLEARLLQQTLPDRGRGLIDRLSAWLLPAPDHVLRQLWRPVAAACLPLAIGLLVGFQFELVPEVSATTVEEELYLISLSDYAEIL